MDLAAYPARELQKGKGQGMEPLEGGPGLPVPKKNFAGRGKTAGKDIFRSICFEVDWYQERHCCCNDCQSANRLSLVLFDQGNEIIKQVAAIVRAGRAFRVVLYGEGRFVLQADTFNAIVIEVYVGDLHMGSLGY